MRAWLITVVLLALSGCASLPDGFTMYPQPLGQDQKPPEGMAVVLVGVVGPGEVDYMQFNHSSLPAINVRFPPRADSIVAIPMPVGIRDLKLSTITLKGRPGFYLGSVAAGFTAVHTHRIDLAKPGLYYLATLDTSQPGKYVDKPIPLQLKELRARHTGLQSIQPVNFAWPTD